jgi:hypothetical protein
MMEVVNQACLMEEGVPTRKDIYQKKEESGIARQENERQRKRSDRTLSKFNGG